MKTVETRRIEFQRIDSNSFGYIYLKNGERKWLDEMTKLDWLQADGMLIKTEIKVDDKEKKRRRKLVRRSKKMAVYF